MQEYHASVDCEEANAFIEGLLEDPMSAGAPLDEIIDGWLKKHVKTCTACQDATVLARMP